MLFPHLGHCEGKKLRTASYSISIFDWLGLFLRNRKLEQLGHGLIFIKTKPAQMGYAIENRLRLSYVALFVASL